MEVDILLSPPPAALPAAAAAAAAVSPLAAVSFSFLHYMQQQRKTPKLLRPDAPRGCSRTENK